MSCIGYRVSSVELERIMCVMAEELPCSYPVVCCVGEGISEEEGYPVAMSSVKLDSRVGEE